LFGRILLPEEFSGGNAPGQANFVLRQLGFTIVAKGSEIESEESDDSLASRQPWSRPEVELIITDYFLMLQAELAGAPYNKADHNRDLRPLLNNRSKSSVELKHRNISAVLVQMGLPYIDGYLPHGTIRRRSCPRRSRIT
jgi:hypothetical protein